MRLKFTFFLLALNLVVFGLIVYLGQEKQSAQSGERGLASQIGRELIDADRIELRGSGLEAPQVLVREGTSWALEKPMRWPANYFAVNRILNQLQFIEEEASFSIDELASTGQTLEDYGLREPSLNLTIAEGDKAVSLSVGTLTEIGNNVYLLGPGKDRVYVIERQVIDGLLLNLNDLRKREIFEIPVFEVQELSLQIRSSDIGTTSDLKVRLANNGGKWSFEAPLTAEADPALVSNTINTLAAVKVGRFIEPGTIDPLRLGLENPFMRVTLHGNKRRQTLTVGNLDPARENGAPFYYAKLESNPAVFTVQARPFDELVQAQEALRERHFMNLEGRQLDAIHLSENGRQLRLQTIESGQWQVLESNGDNELQPRRADRAVVDQMVADLTNLRASEFAVDAPVSVDLERLGFNQPRRVVKIFFEDGTSMTLELAHPEEDNETLYARTDHAEFIYEVERRPTLQSLPLSALHFRSRNLESLPQAAVVKSLALIDAETAEPVFRYSLGSGQTDWASVLKAAIEDEDDRQAVMTLRDAIRNFRVSHYLKDGFEPEGYPLGPERVLPWRYRLEATLLLPGSDSDQTRKDAYVFTKRLSGSKQFGGSANHQTMFELTQRMIDALYQLTDSMDPPPEARGESPESPDTIQPVAEPKPLPSPEATP